jgi:hypothetical protein
VTPPQEVAGGAGQIGRNLSAMSINQPPPGAASTSLLDRLVACVPYGTGGCRTGGRRRAVLPRVCEVSPSPSPSLGASAAAANMPRLFIVDHGRGGQFTHDRVGAERDVLRAVRDTMDQHDNGWTTVADILFQREGFTVIAFDDMTDQLAAAAVLQLSPRTKLRPAALVIRLALTVSLHQRRGFMKLVMWGIHHGARARDIRDLFLEVSNLDDTGSYWIKHCNFSLPNVQAALNVSEDEVYFFKGTDLLTSAVVLEAPSLLSMLKSVRSEATVRSPYKPSNQRALRPIVAQAAVCRQVWHGHYVCRVVSVCRHIVSSPCTSHVVATLLRLPPLCDKR